MQHRNLLAHKHALVDLETRGLRVTGIVYSGKVAAADAATFHKLVDKAGPILVGALMKHPVTEEHILINAFTGKPLTSSGKFVHDPEARLYWAGGMAVSKDTNSVYDGPDCGATFGGEQSFTVFHSGAAMDGRHSLRARHASYPDFDPSTARTVFPPNASRSMELVGLEVYAVSDRTALLPRTVQHPDGQGLKVGRVLYHSGEGSVKAPDDWHKQVDGKGPTVSCVTLQHPTTQELIVVNALVMEPWKSGGGAYQADPKAALIWPGGVALSKDGNSMYNIAGYGPTLGGHALRVIPPTGGLVRTGHASYPDFDPSTPLTQFAANTNTTMTLVSLVTYEVVPKDAPVAADPWEAATTADATYAAWPAPLAAPMEPPAPPVVDGPGTMLENFDEEASIRVQPAGPPNSGKSELLSCLASVLSGRPQNAFSSSGSATIGQCTTAMQCRPMIKMYARGAAKVLAEHGKELYFVDGMGFTNETALAASLLGMQRQGEVFVVDPSDPATMRSEILSRGCDPSRMVHCVILCVRASALVDPATPANSEYLAKVTKIMKQCSFLNPGAFGSQSEGKTGFQIQVLPVITCVDELAECDGKDVHSLYDPAVQRKLVAACESAGIPPRLAVFIGWLTKKPRNGYGDMSDPRVQALWSILCQCVSDGVNTKAMVREAGWTEEEGEEE